jgi:hypothetical protein
MGVIALMRTIGFGELSSNLCGFLFFMPWIIDHLDCGKIVQSALFSIIEVFFSELGSRGTSKVPEGGMHCFSTPPPWPSGKAAPATTCACTEIKPPNVALSLT